MTESDWKIFKQIKDKAMDRYCSLCLAEFHDVIVDESKQAHERYLANYKLVKSSDIKMSTLFDGHSRSSAWLQLLAIRGEGLADEELLLQLTDDFRNNTDPEKHKL